MSPGVLRSSEGWRERSDVEAGRPGRPALMSPAAIERSEGGPAAAVGCAGRSGLRRPRAPGTPGNGRADPRRTSSSPRRVPGTPGTSGPTDRAPQPTHAGRWQARREGPPVLRGREAGRQRQGRREARPEPRLGVGGGGASREVLRALALLRYSAAKRPFGRVMRALVGAGDGRRQDSGSEAT